MESSADRHVYHSFVTHCLVKQPRHIHAVLVRNLPERPDNVPKTSELEGAHKMDAFVNESVNLIHPSGTGGEKTKER